MIGTENDRSAEQTGGPLAQLPSGDESRLEGRAPEIERMRRNGCRVAAVLGFTPRPLDVLAGVAPRTRRTASRRRSNEAAAHVGVECLALDTEAPRRFRRRQPALINHTLIIRSTLTQ